MDQFDRFGPNLPNRSWQPIKLSYSCCSGFSVTGLWLFQQTEALAHAGSTLNKWEAHMQTVVIPTPFTWFGCKYPQIKADSLQLKHILFVSFEIHCGGV